MGPACHPLSPNASIREITSDRASTLLPQTNTYPLTLSAESKEVAATFWKDETSRTF